MHIIKQKSLSTYQNESFNFVIERQGVVWAHVMWISLWTCSLNMHTEVKITANVICTELKYKGTKKWSRLTKNN